MTAEAEAPDLPGLPVLPAGTDLRVPFDRERAVLDHRVGPVGRLLVDVEGGPGLVGALRELEGWAADPGSLVEVVAAYERVAAWARSRAVAAAARLAATPEMNPHWPATVGTPAATAAAATELSLRLGVSRRTGDTFVAMGRALDGLHAGTGDALAAGRLDWPRARVLVEALEHVAPAVALEVEDKVLARAEAMTTTQLRREVARVLEEIDPEDAADRHAHARTRRHVSRPRALPDGMASMTAVLTVEAAVRLDACLQAAADGARHDGDPRTVDQLRADALDAMGEVAWLQGAIGPVPSSVGTPADQSAAATRPDLPVRAATGSRMPLRGPAGGRPRINVTVGIGTLLGLDDRPGELAGYGPIGADAARRLAVDGTWRRLLVDEPSGTILDVGTRRYRPPPDLVELIRERNRTCVVPTCGMPSRQCQTDHTVPFPRVDGRPDVGPDLQGGRPVGSTEQAVVDPTDTGAAEAEPTEAEPAEAQPAEAQPAEARSGGAEPAAGPVLGGRADVGASDGEPMDLDSGPAGGGTTNLVQPGGAPLGPGRTAADNLGPLCGTHHLLKTHGGFRLEQPHPGSFVLRTPSGHVYLQGPDRPPGVPSGDAAPSRCLPQSWLSPGGDAAPSPGGDAAGRDDPGHGPPPF